MPNGCCCVPGCANRGGHAFPLEKERRRKWIIAVKREEFEPTRHTIVCRKHFTEADYHQSEHSVDGKFKLINRMQSLPPFPIQAFPLKCLDGMDVITSFQGLFSNLNQPLEMQ